MEAWRVEVCVYSRYGGIGYLKAMSKWWELCRGFGLLDGGFEVEGVWGRGLGEEEGRRGGGGGVR